MEQHDIEKTIEEVRLFLNLIDDNADSILQKLSLKTEHMSCNEADTAFFCCLEEDAEEIKKALIVINNYIEKIKS